MGKSAFKPGNMLYPLPAVMVSCQYPGTSDPECSNPALSGRPNILTVAWAGTVCTNPPMLSTSVRPERYSYHMIEAAGEFVVNLTTESLVRATDYCGVRSGRDVDKFKEMHLTPLASREVSVPGIAESPVNIECRVRQITPLGSHNLILADVVAVATSLATTGPDITQVTMHSVPGWTGDDHCITAEIDGVKATVDICSSTSAIAGWSAVALLRNLASPVCFY